MSDMRSWVGTATMLTFIAADGCGGEAAPADQSRPATSTPSISGVPPEFREACGHPGATVVVRHEPVTVAHATCDLTGVTVEMKNCGGAVVPHPGEGVGTRSRITVSVDGKTRDVTVSVPGPCGNY